MQIYEYHQNVVSFQKEGDVFALEFDNGFSKNVTLAPKHRRAEKQCDESKAIYNSIQAKINKTKGKLQSIKFDIQKDFYDLSNELKFGPNCMRGEVNKFNNDYFLHSFNVLHFISVNRR